ncbi:MAG: hypothetical protein ACOC2W_00760 [bacterium]
MTINTVAALRLLYLASIYGGQHLINKISEMSLNKDEFDINELEMKFKNPETYFDNKEDV